MLWSQNPSNYKCQQQMPLSKNKKYLQSLLGILNNLDKFCPQQQKCATIEIPDISLSWMDMEYKLSRTLWPGIKKDVCMKFYEAKKPLYREADTSRIGLGTGKGQDKIYANEAPDNTTHAP